jgi:TonB family protein
MQANHVSRAAAASLLCLLGLSSAHLVAAADLPPEAPSARPLPRSHITSHGSWYPAKAVRSHLQGRVLVEFKIDPKGHVTDARMLESDADPLLQHQALTLLQSTVFDVSEPQSVATNGLPFRATYAFCLRPCGPLSPYAGSELIPVTSASIPGPR